MSSGGSGLEPVHELTASRARFVGELGERIAAVRQGLARIASGDGDGELNAARRRLHALAAAADVLHFASTAEALTLAEAALGSSTNGAPSAPARERVGHVLDLLPSLALGASIDLRRELDREPARALSEPLCIVLFGDPALEAALHKPGPLREPDTHATRDPARVFQLVARLDPDAIVLDADEAGCGDLIPRLRQEVSAAPLVAIGSFEHHEPLQRLMRRGLSRMLPKPVDPGALQRILRALPGPPAEELSDPARFQRLTREELVLAIAAEARRAFGDSPLHDRALPPLDLGSGREAFSALWAAFARIRALAAAASEGAARFPLSGPSGAIALAPLTADAAPSPSSSGAAGAILSGRRIVVAAAAIPERKLLARSIEALGASVLLAEDGLRALELTEQHWPDAVLADSLLPALDGFALCQHLRSDIALSDLPVALITWKEGVLTAAQSAADSSSERRVLDPRSLAGDLEAALSPRALLERRLAQHPNPRGRLDGMTPRLLLQLTCSRTPNALLTLRSGSLRFEIALCEGRPAAAHAFEGSALRAEGAAVLPALLGVRTGRFALEPLTSAPAAHFSADLMTVLDPVVARARRARQLMGSSALERVLRVLFDPVALTPWLERAPGARRSLAARLQGGASPRSLTPEHGEGAGDPLLRATLVSLAESGAIHSLLDADGDDLLGNTASRELRRDPEFTAPEPSRVLDLADVVLQAMSHTPGPPRFDSPSPEAGATYPAPVEQPATSEAWDAPEPAVPEPSLEASARGEALRAPRGETRLHSQSVPPAAASFGLDLDALELSQTRDAPEENDASEEPQRPFTLRARSKAVAVPLVVTLGAATLAFAAVRALGSRNWQTSSGALHGAAADAGGPTAPDPTRARAALGASAPAAGTSAASTSSPDMASDELAHERRKVPVDVVFESETLKVPAHVRLRPGHGLLEVRTWERQHIYVDGVFMGNYEARLIPLAPGTYQVRLRDGARHIERPVEVHAGQRTRLSARPKRRR